MTEIDALIFCLVKLFGGRWVSRIKSYKKHPSSFVIVSSIGAEIVSQNWTRHRT